MHPIIEKLKDWGCDTACIASRFLGDEGFYLEMLPLAVGDQNFAALDAALTAGDPKAAFAAAHALKGMLGNLGLTPLYRPVCEITEQLRGGEMRDVSAAGAEVARAYQHLAALLDGTAEA